VPHRGTLSSLRLNTVLAPFEKETIEARL